MARRVARVFHGHLPRRRTGVSPGRRRRVIPAYICAASIWTYDGNNLEALGARRTCKPGARVLVPGMCSGCDGGIRRDEYDGVCATVEGAKPQ